MPSRYLHLRIRDLLYISHEEPENSMLVTLALMVMVLILGRSIKFWERRSECRPICTAQCSAAL